MYNSHAAMTQMLCDEMVKWALLIDSSTDEVIEARQDAKRLNRDAKTYEPIRNAVNANAIYNRMHGASSEALRRHRLS